MSESPDKQDTPVAKTNTPLEAETAEVKSEAASPEHQVPTPADDLEKVFRIKGLTFLFQKS